MREKIRSGDTTFVSNSEPVEAGFEGHKSNVIRVLVAEDHTVVRDGLVAIIKQEADMDVVAETGDGQQAAELWKKHRPDVTLMDLRLPDLSGIDAMIAIRAEFAEARIIMLTTFEGDVEIQRALKAGARGYLLKNLPPDELLADVIRHVHKGKKRPRWSV